MYITLIQRNSSLKREYSSKGVNTGRCRLLSSCPDSLAADIFLSRSLVCCCCRRLASPTNKLLTWGTSIQGHIFRSRCGTRIRPPPFHSLSPTFPTCLPRSTRHRLRFIIYTGSSLSPDNSRRRFASFRPSIFYCPAFPPRSACFLKNVRS